LPTAQIDVLTPREHGAYGQLLFPLAAALLAGHPAAGAMFLGLAAAAGFLAHEALLVVLGQRGPRARREQAGAARRSLFVFGTAFVAAGLASIFTLPRNVLPILVAPATLSALVAVMVWLHRERTTLGEILVGTALASVSLPVALASGLPMRAAITLALVFAVVFAMATVAVRSVIGRVSKAGGPSSQVAASMAILVYSVFGLLSSRGMLSGVAPYAAVPVCLVAVVLSIKPPSPRYLRVVGWTLVGATALTTAILVIGLS
jgi:hypothetical protein